MTPLGNVDRYCECPFIGVNRSFALRARNDAIEQLADMRSGEGAILDPATSDN